MTITAEKPVAGGTCLARAEGKAVFVPFVLPGETAEIEIVENRKDWARARLVRVLEKSPRRIEPACPLFGVCGGCALQMADAAYQGELRAAVAADSLRRAGSSWVADIPVVSLSSWEYRSRVQFHPGPKGEPGFSAARSSEVIPVKDCPVLVSELRSALADGTIAREMNRFFSPANAPSRPAENRAGNRNRSARLRTNRVSTDSRRFQVFAGNGKLFHEGGETRAAVSVSGRTIHFDVRGFFQSNLGMLEILAADVTADLKPSAAILDFYSGVGTFSAFAAEKIGRAVLVEHNGAALEFARENVELPADSLELCSVSDEKWPEHPASRQHYDTAIVDPPRQGLARRTLDWFASSSIPEIRYVSCDPVTFARDSALLERSGYRLEKVTLYDFYPQTHHAEVYGRFTR